MLEEFLIFQKMFFCFDGFREFLTTHSRNKSRQKAQNVQMNVFMVILHYL